jgi:hypothetical protein
MSKVPGVSEQHQLSLTNQSVQNPQSEQVKQLLRLVPVLLSLDAERSVMSVDTIYYDVMDIPETDMEQLPGKAAKSVRPGTPSMDCLLSLGAAGLHPITMKEKGFNRWFLLVGVFRNPQIGGIVKVRDYDTFIAEHTSTGSGQQGIPIQLASASNEKK